MKFLDNAKKCRIVSHPDTFLFMLLSRASETLRGSVGARGQFAVKLEKAGAVLADKVERIDEMTHILFLLYLLGYVPVELLSRGVILLLLSGGIQLVDGSRHALLMVERVDKCPFHAGPRRRHFRDGLQLHAAVAGVQIVEKAESVGLLLLILDAKPVGYAVEAFGLEMARHREVKVSRPEFGVYLLVERSFYFGTYHGYKSVKRLFNKIC